MRTRKCSAITRCWRAGPIPARSCMRGWARAQASAARSSSSRRSSLECVGRRHGSGESSRWWAQENGNAYLFVIEFRHGRDLPEAVCRLQQCFGTAAHCAVDAVSVDGRWRRRAFNRDAERRRTAFRARQVNHWIALTGRSGAATHHDHRRSSSASSSVAVSPRRLATNPCLCSRRSSRMV
jgi:hypothetical protein